MAPFTLLAAVATLSLAAGSVVKTPRNDGTFELLILHNNDMHARFEQTSQLSGTCTAADRDAGKCYGGFPRVAHVVKEARKAAASGEGPPVLYLNAGDTYTGTAWFTIYKWKIAAEFLNALKPDAVSLGNHEMDERVDGLTPFIRNVTTPVLAANLILDKVPELQNEKNLKKSVVINVNGVKVGIIGYLTPETRYLAPKNDVEYEDEVVALQREVAILQDHGINILIALGHSGYVTDLKIAREVEGLDLVIGGHSNTFLFNGQSTEKPEQVEGPYPKMVKQISGKIVPVVQAYAYTKYLGRLNLIFDASGEIVELHGAPILLKQDIPQDPDVLRILNKYKEDVDRVNNEAVGSSLVFLEGQCRLRQCNMGNLITDAILDYTKIKDVCANIAIIQGGRIRAPIDRPQKPFIMNRGDWFTVIPFSDPQSVVIMNGTILLQALEHAVDGWRLIDTPGQFLQFSGMQVLYDLANPIGSRVISAKAKASLSNDTCSESDFVDIKKDMQYRVIMPTFLAEGGDGFTMFERLPTEITTFGELEATISYVGRNSPVSPVIDDRLLLINEDKVASSNTKTKSREGRVLHSNAHFHSLSLVPIVINFSLTIFPLMLVT